MSIDRGAGEAGIIIQSVRVVEGKRNRGAYLGRVDHGACLNGCGSRRCRSDADGLVMTWALSASRSGQSVGTLTTLTRPFTRGGAPPYC